MNIQNKVVVITGGTDGIGRALVDYYLNNGAKVATCARNNDKLYELTTSHAGKNLHTMVADVSIENDCQRFIQTTLETFGHIDILINNAGISMRCLFEDVSLETIRAVMEINFFGVVNCIKFALPSIISTKGTIVGISSIAGYRGLPGRTAYSASKHALNGFLEALKTELLAKDVHVMWVAPGFVKTNVRIAALTKNGEKINESPMDESKMMSAEECALEIIKAIENKNRTLVMTALGKATVWMNKLFPKLADKKIEKFYFKDGQLLK